MDDGSQIVAVSEEAARELGLTYDPKITLGVQSANKQVERSLGLAKNVRFTLGGTVNLYMQVHVIRNPAYRVLLGRPFSALAQTNVQNSLNGNMTIMATDPNSGAQVILPTYDRGVTPEHLQKKRLDTSAFRETSMN